MNHKIAYAWQHDLASAAKAVHADFVVNENYMADIQGELTNPEQAMPNDNVEWAQWVAQEVNQAEQQDDNDDAIMEEVQQQEISFDQSGSMLTAIISHFDRQLLVNNMSFTPCSIHILLISNKCNKFWMSCGRRN